MPIPHLIHQTWKTCDVPDRWRPLAATWTDLHPSWEYCLWSDADCRALVAAHYSDFLPVYDAYDENIKRSDAWRYMVLHRYGGLYVDLDMEALRPLDALLAGPAIVLAQEPASHAAPGILSSRGLTRMVGNAFMASAPGHPFWLHVLDVLAAQRDAPSPLDATGPFALTRALDSYTPNANGVDSNIIVLPAALINPVDKDTAWQDDFDAAAARVHFAESAYTLHYWHSTWRREAVLRAALAHHRNKT